MNNLIEQEFQIGIDYHRKGNFFEAENKYKKVLSNDANHFDSLHLLGVLNSQKGNYDLATHYIKKAIMLNDLNPMAFNNLAINYLETKKFSKAIKYNNKALSLNNNYTEALNTKGKILIETHKYDDAETYFKKAIKLNPNFFEAYFNLGILTTKLNQINSSIKYYQRTIDLKPDFANAHFNLANLYLMNDKGYMAKKHYETCLKLNYDKSKIYNNLGHIYEKNNDLENAKLSYKNAIDIDKKDLKAKHNLINLDLKASNWSNIESYIRLFKDKDSFAEHGLPINLHAILDNPELQKFFNENYLSYSSINSKSNNLYKKNTKIKVGYFSADFSDNNPVAYLITDLIKYHDRSKFEIYGFSLKNQKNKDLTRKFYEHNFDKFFDIQELSDQEIKDICIDHSLDIAIDLNGYTKNSRPTIFSQKLGKIQINFLGYPGTLGSENYDYIIADKIVIPENLKRYYTEKIIYMPHTYFVNPSRRPVSSKTFTKEDLSIDQDSFVYCCFNQNYKILPKVFNSWMNILKNVDGSILLLSHTNKTAITNLKLEADKRKVDPNRIKFTSYLNNIADHLKRYQVTDVFLDTMPYNAHTTASDAIWCGIPLVTCKGKSFASRVSSSILSSVGLNELITNSLEEYEAKAIEVANNPKLLSDLKNRITVNKDNLNLFNSKKYVKNIELSFQKVNENIHSSNKLVDIEIKDD